MKRSVTYKVQKDEPGLYVSLIFPISFSFLLTFAGSRLISYLITYGYMPGIYWQPEPGVHVHHFVYGVFVLALAGYLALVFNGPSGTFWIALLLGFGLGLALDEFIMWFHLRDDEPARWSYDGLTLFIATIFLIITAKSGLRLVRKLFPFGR